MSSWKNWRCVRFTVKVSVFPGRVLLQLRNWPHTVSSASLPMLMERPVSSAAGSRSLKLSIDPSAATKAQHRFEALQFAGSQTKDRLVP